MFFYLILLFTVLPAAELYLLIKIGSLIGAFNTVLIIVFTGVLGAYMAKLEGLRVWYEFNKNVGKGVMPAEQIIDGVMVFTGGVLLITPGFITDISGFLLIIPLTRDQIKRLLRKWVKSKIERGNTVVNVSFFNDENGNH
ncbi:MAG: membrane protein FxsA [Candidatus Aureabacteria bacterium]|nr:membrane protein FxsA [Candidatus Auribacterota bacterium]